jgi:hypothetical protein
MPLPKKPVRPKPKPLRPGTVEHSLKVVGTFCRGPEHNDYYDMSEGLTLALALLPESERRRFDRLYAKWKDAAKFGPATRQKFSSMEDFIEKTGVQPMEPKVVYVEPRNYRA